MEIGKDLLKLVRLSKIDAKIFDVKNKKEQDTALLEKCNSESEALKENLGRDHEELKKLVLIIKKHEGEIKKCDDEIKKSDFSLSQVKKNDEYKVILRQIEEQKKSKLLKEELFLESLEKEEFLKISLADKERDQKKALEFIDNRKSKILDHLRQTEEEIKSCISRRESIFESLRRDIKEEYLKILNRREDQALSIIKNNEYCGSCAMILMPEMIENTRRGHSLICCPTCSRILYHSDYLARISSQHLDDMI